MLYLQKGRFQKVANALGGSWMTANQATFLGVVSVLLVSASYYVGFSYGQYRWVLLLVPLFLFTRMAMNTLDGLISRRNKTATVSGELWNEALDVFGDTLCYGSLLFVESIPTLTVTVLLVFIWSAEFFGVLGKSMPGGVRRHETFGGGKPDRAFWMGLMAFILFFYPMWMQYAGWYLLFVSALVAGTSLIRIKETLRASKGKEYKSYTWIGE